MRIQLSIAAALASVAIVPLAGQTRSATLRLADGHPDLQGTYDLAMLTPVERAAGSPLVLADEDARKLERQAAARKVAGDVPLKADRPAPPVGGDGSAVHPEGDRLRHAGRRRRIGAPGSTARGRSGSASRESRPPRGARCRATS